ncbi:MAG: ATP-binding protein [Alphaproteobacteria bacterium]|nr:MAG: ATP-binding protein [Alphaproteobacteria bacterium]
MKEDRALNAALRKLALNKAARAYVVSRLTEPEQRTVREQWPFWAHEGQLPPPGDWRTWLISAGRGFGKTRAGAEWVSALARADGSLRIALVGASASEVERVMIRGESGLIAVAHGDEDLLWYPTRGLVEFSSGARGFVYSGANPEALRGPEHHHAWCDELAKWAYPEATWSNLMLGLRLGERARTLVTTTPRPLALLRRLAAAPDSVLTGGRTGDNLYLPEDFVAAMSTLYAGTRLGRQELDGELIEDLDGALWTRAMVEEGRVALGTVAGNCPRVVIGVDPPASSGGDACGIVVCGLDSDGVGYVLDDRSVRGMAPEGWARAVVAAAEDWGADRVVAETNQGGEMVESVLRSVDSALPVRPARARYGKGRRAEPVSALFARGKAKFAGVFPELEDELCGMTAAGYEGPGRSPDRADAMVWAMSELMLGVRREPRIRVL